MSGLKLLLVIVLWVVYAGTLTRALIQRRSDNEFRIVVWGMFFLACLAFTFTGQEVEQATDQFFGGLPVSIYIKYFALTHGVHLYCSLLHRVKPLSERTFRALRWLNRTALAAGVGSFILLVLFDVRDHPDVRYYVSAARDVIVALYMLLTIIPRNFTLFKAETVPTMQIKHVLNTLLCVTHVLIAVTSLISLVVIMFDLADINRLLPIFLPLTYLVYLFFLSALMPHRWTAVLLFPARLYTYWRLLRLQQEVQRLTQVNFHFDSLSIRFSAPSELEFAIYKTVIFILDHAVLMQNNADENHLSNRLTRFLQTERTYPTLVKGLVKLSYDRSHS